MPLHLPPAPAPALRSLHAALNAPTVIRSRRTPPALRGAQSPLRPTSPLPLHVLAPSSEPHDPPHTRLIGWRFLLGDGERTLGAAEVTPTADGWAFSHFCEGPYVASSERALHQAESLTAAYQPRLLSIPELYMLTLWLHGTTEADAGEGVPTAADVLVPLAPAPPGIAAHRAHRADRLLPLINDRLAGVALLKTPA